ncbi:hypothetical protein C5167_018101 [Papaver somniferum]|uniref:Uncharacterized protein n=1 Tax=Papaver somniferum TaxID=3469 RepID=A0A4Y7IPN6_PAPSO|nr:hypothetical protein C5167_018101 [Papaver somniferum]
MPRSALLIDIRRQAIKIKKMPRGAGLTDIRRQARISSPYHITASQKGHDERHDSSIIAPRVRLINIRIQAREVTNTSPAIPKDGMLRAINHMILGSRTLGKGRVPLCRYGSINLVKSKEVESLNFCQFPLFIWDRDEETLYWFHLRGGDFKLALKNAFTNAKTVSDAKKGFKYMAGSDRSVYL